MKTNTKFFKDGDEGIEIPGYVDKFDILKILWCINIFNIINYIKRNNTKEK